MSHYYCTRPHCPSPENHFSDLTTDSEIFCQTCGMPLILKGRRGHYQPLGRLGRGGFGSTFQAIDLDSVNKRQCVIKRLDIKFDEIQTANRNPEEVNKIVKGIEAAFEREAKVLEILGESGNIPSLYDYFSLTAPHFGQQQDMEFKYSVQQYIQGEDLSKELRRKGRFSEEDILDFLEQILPTLEFIHKQNSIHRDIKPGNIVRETATQKLFLIDFGAVKQVFSGQINVQSSIVFGTKVYASPEQRSRTNVEPSSDLYSLAVTCLELITGTTPVDYLDNNYGNWRQQATGIISAPLAKILDKMLQVKPVNRFDSATKVITALKEFQENKISGYDSDSTRIIDERDTKLRFKKLKPVLIKSVFLILPIIVSAIGVNIYLQPGKVVEYAQSGIRFKYPQDWQEMSKDENLTRIIPKNKILSALSPEFFITIEDLFKSETLKDYTKFAIAQIEKSAQNVKIIKSAAIKLNGREGHQIVYELRDNINKVNLKEMQVWIVDNQKAYILTYRAEDKFYPDFAEIVEQTIIKSFQLEKPEKSTSGQSTDHVW